MDAHGLKQINALSKTRDLTAEQRLSGNMLITFQSAVREIGVEAFMALTVDDLHAGRLPTLTKP